MNTVYAVRRGGTSHFRSVRKQPVAYVREVAERSEDQGLLPGDFRVCDIHTGGMFAVVHRDASYPGEYAVTLSDPEDYDALRERIPGTFPSLERALYTLMCRAWPYAMGGAYQVSIEKETR